MTTASIANRRHRPLNGFSLIELLVVVSIIGVLAGMLLVVSNMLRESAKRSRTSAIQQIIQQALSLQAAQHGGLPSPAEHPLAGSRAPRTSFVRADGAHTAVNPSGMALLGATVADLTTGSDRLLLPNDLLADPDIPGLYGVARSRLGILGMDTIDETAYFRIKLGSPPVDPTVATNYLAVAPTETPAQRQALLQFWIPGSPWSELVKLGAVNTPTDDVAAHLIGNGRVWSPEAAGAKASPCRIKDSGTWKSYRLRGAVIVDGWGREMLFSVIDGHSVNLESAGRDGFFRWNHGPDDVFQTDPWGARAGDDTDASLDNVTLGQP